MERRTGDPAAGQCRLRAGRVEGRRIVHVRERRLGNTEARQCLLAHSLDRGQRTHSRESAGNHPRHAPVDAKCELRCVRGSAEGVERVTERHRRGVDDVERATVETLEMRDVVDRLGDEVDRNDVERSALGADERHPLGKRVAHLLDELERVVRAVDAIRLAGVGRTDDHAGAIHPPGDGRLGAHDPFRLVLGLVIRMVERLTLVEHRLGEGAFEPSRDGDRADQVQAARAHLVGETDDVARAGDVGTLGLVGRRGQVVDGGEMKHVSPAELLAIVHGKPKPRLDQFAAQRVESLAPGIEALTLRGEAGTRAMADEHEDVVASREQQRHQVAADESGRPGDEVGHSADNSFLGQSETEHA